MSLTEHELKVLRAVDQCEHMATCHTLGSLLAGDVLGIKVMSNVELVQAIGVLMIKKLISARGGYEHTNDGGYAIVWHYSLTADGWLTLRAAKENNT